MNLSNRKLREHLSNADGMVGGGTNIFSTTGGRTTGGTATAGTTVGGTTSIGSLTPSRTTVITQGSSQVPIQTGFTVKSTPINPQGGISPSGTILPGVLPGTTPVIVLPGALPSTPVTSGGGGGGSSEPSADQTATPTEAPKSFFQSPVGKVAIVALVGAGLVYFFKK